MSGGSWEYVMGNYNDIVGNSGFEIMPDIKYYDKYISGNVSMTCNGNECLGHGLFETSKWYSDYDGVISTTYSWLVRSGGYNYGIEAGIFRFSPWVPGDANSGSISFRLVMSPSI